MLQQPLAFLVVAVQVYLVYLLLRCSDVVGAATTDGPGRAKRGLTSAPTGAQRSKTDAWVRY